MRLTVADRATLAEVCDWISARYPGVIPKATMSRLRNQKSAAVDSSTIEALGAVLRTDGSREAGRMLMRLWPAVLSAEFEELRLFHEIWASYSLKAFFDRDTPRAKRVGPEWLPIEQELSPEQARYETYASRGDDPFRAREVEYRALLARLAALPVGEELERLKAELLAYGGVQPDLARLMVLRIIGPLLESAESGYVEPHWREFNNDELTRFVRAGITRERMLLKKRGHVSARLQEVSHYAMKLQRPRRSSAATDAFSSWSRRLTRKTVLFEARGGDSESIED